MGCGGSSSVASTKPRNVTTLTSAPPANCLPIKELALPANVRVVKVRVKMGVLIDGVEFNFSNGTTKFFGGTGGSWQDPNSDFLLGPNEVITKIQFRQERLQGPNSSLSSIQFFTNLERRSKHYAGDGWRVNEQNKIAPRTVQFLQEAKSTLGFVGIKRAPPASSRYNCPVIVGFFEKASSPVVTTSVSSSSPLVLQPPPAATTFPTNNAIGSLNGNVDPFVWIPASSPGFDLSRLPVSAAVGQDWDGSKLYMVRSVLPDGSILVGKFGVAFRDGCAHVAWNNQETHCRSFEVLAGCQEGYQMSFSAGGVTPDSVVVGRTVSGQEVYAAIVTHTEQGRGVTSPGYSLDFGKTCCVGFADVVRFHPGAMVLTVSRIPQQQVVYQQQPMQSSYQ